MNVIKNRITRALGITLESSLYHQRKRGGPRRGPHQRGVIALPHSVNVRFSSDLKGALDTFCAQMEVERGIVVRDAVAFYLGMAEQEGVDLKDCPTTVRKRTYKRRDRPE